MTTTNLDAGEPRHLARLLADLLPLFDLAAEQPDGRFYCTLGPLDADTGAALRQRIREALTDPDLGLERIVLAYLGQRIDWEEIETLATPTTTEVLLWRPDLGIDIAYPGWDECSPDEVTHWAPIPAPATEPTADDRNRARRLIAEVRDWATIEPGVQVVDLQPDDVLIAKLRRDCTPETARAIGDALQARFDRPIFIVANDADIDVADPADLAPAVPATTRHVLPLGAGGEGVEVEADSAGFLRLTAAELEGHLDAIHAARRSANGRAAIGEEALALLEHGLEMDAGSFRLQRGRLLDKARRDGVGPPPLSVRTHNFPPDRDGCATTLHYVIDSAGTVDVAAEIFEREVLPALDLAHRIRALPDSAVDQLAATVGDLSRRHAQERAAVVELVRNAVEHYRDSYTGP